MLPVCLSTLLLFESWTVVVCIVKWTSKLLVSNVLWTWVVQGEAKSCHLLISICARALVKFEVCCGLWYMQDFKDPQREKVISLNQPNCRSHQVLSTFIIEGAVWVAAWPCCKSSKAHFQLWLWLLLCRRRP